MRKLAFNIVWIVLPLVVVMTACDGVFVPDPIDPRLPKYTEDGNNAAGVIIGNETWTSIIESNFPNSSLQAPSFFLYPQNDSMKIVFDGISPRFRFIEFQFSPATINDLSDFQELHNRTIIFDGTSASAFCYSNNDTSWNSLGNEGQIFFRKVVYDSIARNVTMSGTFGFIFDDWEYGVTKASYGRFDYRFTSESLTVFP